MKILAIETTTLAGGVALMDEEKLIAEHRLHVDARHAERVMVSIDQILNQGQTKVADLDAIAVSIGPGSFTGLRVGLSTAKGLAMGAGLPLVLVPTLEVMGAAFPFVKPIVAPIIDARQAHVYWAVFDTASGLLSRCLPDAASSPALAIETIASSEHWATRDVLCVGDGAMKYREMISEKMGGRACFPGKALQFPSAAHLAELGIMRFLKGEVTSPELATPIYIRASAAELKHAAAKT